MIRRADEMEFKEEIEQNILKKLRNGTELDKFNQEELEKKYGIWVSVEKAMEITGKSKSTIYKYKDENLFIYKQSMRKISIYTRSLILVL